MAYSMEYRRAVAKAYDECGSSIEMAEQFVCSESWVRRLIQRRRETGSLEPRPIKLPDNDVMQAIGVVFASVSEQDATNFIRHCGYAATNE